MAMQHLFAYSARVDGAGIAAGSPYGCGAFPHRMQHCYYGNADIAGSIAYIRWQFARGEIDDPSNLQQTPVLLFNGQNDWVVYTEVMRETLKQLRAFVNPQQLATRFRTGAAHVWSLDHGSCGCGFCDFVSEPPVCCNVNNCHYDLSGDMLTHIYGTLAPRTMAVQPLRLVDQWSFMPKTGQWRSSGLERWAIVYVPTGCKGAVHRCRVHVNYHGCTARDWNRRRLWASALDLNEYGEANGIVIVYPQAAGDQATGTGCWNWGFAADDPLFDARNSVQLKTVVQLVDGLEAALASSIVLEAEGELPSVLLEPDGNETTGAAGSAGPPPSGLEPGSGAAALPSPPSAGAPSSSPPILAASGGNETATSAAGQAAAPARNTSNADLPDQGQGMEAALAALPVVI